MLLTWFDNRDAGLWQMSAIRLGARYCRKKNLALFTTETTLRSKAHQSTKSIKLCKLAKIRLSAAPLLGDLIDWLAKTLVNSTALPAKPRGLLYTTGHVVS